MFSIKNDARLRAWSISRSILGRILGRISNSISGSISENLRASWRIFEYLRELHRQHPRGNISENNTGSILKHLGELHTGISPLYQRNRAPFAFVIRTSRSLMPSFLLWLFCSSHTWRVPLLSSWSCKNFWSCKLLRCSDVLLQMNASPINRFSLTHNSINTPPWQGLRAWKVLNKLAR